MEKVKQGYFKVSERGSTYKTGVFFNPETKDEYELTIYDYDDERVQYFAGQHYSISINKCVQKMWLHKHNIIQVGDLVEIVSGRKFKGEFKRVTKEFVYSISGMYGRGYGDITYLVFDDGTKVAKYHCQLVQEPERYSLYQVIFERDGELGVLITDKYEFIDDKIKLNFYNEIKQFKLDYFKEIKVIK